MYYPRITKSTAAMLMVTMMAPLFFLAFYIPAHTARAQGADDFVNDPSINGGAPSSSSSNPAASGAAGIASCFPTFLLKRAMSYVFSFIDSLITQGVRTVDAPEVGELYGKDILNCIAWALVNTILKKLAADIIDWINRGFQGKPAFLQDFNRFLLGIADQEIGKFIEGSGLSFLCSPFQVQVRIALARQFSGRSQPSCTLTGAVGNVQAFLNNFQNGGWNSFLAFTTQAQNNPFGGYLLAGSSLSIAISGRQSQELKLLDFGNGFLSYKEKYACTTVSTGDFNENGEEILTEDCKERITTPGATIENSLNQALGSPQRRLEIATEINQIIEALFVALVTKALQGLTGLSKANAYSDDYYRFNPTPITFADSYNAVTGTRVDDPSAPFAVKVQSSDIPCSDANACPDVSRAGRGSQLTLISFGGASLPATNTAVSYYLERVVGGTLQQDLISFGGRRLLPFTWTVPTKGNVCPIDGPCILGDDLEEGITYRIAAEFYSPANFCLAGPCLANGTPQTVIAAAVSLPFVITATGGVEARPVGSFTDQLRDDSQSGTGTGIAQQIDAVIRVEEEVRRIKEQGVAEIENAQISLKTLESCWNSKAVQLSGSDSATASANASNARFTREALEAKKAPFTKAMAEGSARIAKLQDLQARALSAKGVAEADAVLKEFAQSRALGETAGAVDVTIAKTELDQVRSDMSVVNQSTNEKLNQCSVFPQTSTGFQFNNQSSGSGF